MPLSVTDLARKRKNLAIPYEVEPGVVETVNLTYTTAALTPLMIAEVDAFDGQGQARANAAGIRQLCTLIIEWDVTGVDGLPYPLTAEALEILPLEFLVVVYRAILEDFQRPNLPTSAVTSGGGSSRKASRRRIPARNGTH
jgi:hypothetical protein